MESRAVGVVVALVIAIGVLFYKFTQRDDRANEVHDQMIQYFEEFPDYDTHASLYAQWLDNHHEALFDKHYHIGGRRSPSRFDGDEYLEELFTSMIKDAAAAGYKDQAEHLRTLAGELEWTAD